MQYFIVTKSSDNENSFNIFFSVGLPWSLNFGKKANKPDQVKDIKDKSGSTVTVGLSSVMVDKHGASKDNNSASGANNELNTSSDSSSSSSGPLVEFSSSQSNAKEARSVKLWWFYKGLFGRFSSVVSLCTVTVCDTRNCIRGHWGKKGGGGVICILRC